MRHSFYRLGGLLCIALASGCTGESQPTGPGDPPASSQPPAAPAPPPPAEGASITGFIVDESGECIIGARVQVVDGPKAGTDYTQTQCDWWELGYGFYFVGLPSAVPMTLRASAAGYRTVDAMLILTRSGSSDAIIVLERD